MKRVCNACGAEYPDHAEYCNACGGEDLRTRLEPSDTPTVAPIRSDAQALWLAAILWIIGLGYLLTVRRPRDAEDLLLGWLFLSVVTFVLGLALRSLRPTMLFSLLALPFVAIYWYVKLSG